MSDALHTTDGIPIGGWVLRGNRASFDIGPMLERYGQVYRHPVDPGALADLLAPGQPCFLIRTDTSRVVGLWGIGEVVAPVLEVTVASPSGLTPGLYAEVEMFVLAKPIALDTLRSDQVLAASELCRATTAGPNPAVLRPREVRAVEALDFELVPPTPEQVERLDELLAAEDATGA